MDNIGKIIAVVLAVVIVISVVVYIVNSNKNVVGPGSDTLSADQISQVPNSGETLIDESLVLENDSVNLGDVI